MKRFFALLMAILLVLGLAACSGGNSAAGQSGGSQGGGNQSGPYKIAVANILEGETWEICRTYMDEVVGPTLNMEFMYSEKLTDANSLITFMEQAYAAGCTGVINMVTSSDAVTQGANKAQEWGMWFITENSMLVEDVAGLSYNLGHVGAAPDAAGTAYKEALADILSDGENHSVFLFSGAAVGGDIGQGAASHFYSAQGILEAFEEAYGLEYTQSYSEIINNQNPGEVETGNPDVHIYLYPGLNVTDAVSASLPVLQTGTYDIFAAVFSYSAFTNAIADVENSLGMNIRIIGTANIEEQTKTGFESQDSTGDSILNAVVINDNAQALGVKAVMLYNALNGAADAMKDNGKAVFLGVKAWACIGAETFARVEKLNTAPELYALDAEDLKALTVDENPDVTWKDIEAKLAEVGDLELLLGQKGL